jgi:hypothetical protein
MAESVTIPARFNGPPDTGNGGYSCGVAAALLGGAAAEVSLRSPPPLERPLAVRREGDVVRLLDEETLVAEAAPARLPFDAPGAVSVEEAEDASRAGYELWTAGHPFPTCVVCGPRRQDDGYRVFPGPLGDGRYAAAWTPDSSLADDSGRVRLECAWAALDCPTSAPVMSHGKDPPIVLARLGARVGRRPLPGRPHAIVSWPIAVDGRKRHSGAALYDELGDLLAVARALWIELRR